MYSASWLPTSSKSRSVWSSGAYRSTSEKSPPTWFGTFVAKEIESTHGCANRSRRSIKTSDRIRWNGDGLARNAKPPSRAAEVGCFRLRQHLNGQTRVYPSSAASRRFSLTIDLEDRNGSVHASVSVKPQTLDLVL